MNRQYYGHYLNENTKMRFEFNRFVPAEPLPASRKRK
jgi:hypothetical protein